MKPRILKQHRAYYGGDKPRRKPKTGSQFLNLDLTLLRRRSHRIGPHDSAKPPVLRGVGTRPNKYAP